MNFIFFSVDSSTINLGTESDGSNCDFSGDDDRDIDYDHNNDSSSYTSVEKTNETAGKKKITRKTSNQSLQHDFQGMEINSSLDDFNASMSEFNASLDDDLHMETNNERIDRNRRSISTESNSRVAATPNANSTENRADNIDNAENHNMFLIPEEEEIAERNFQRRLFGEQGERRANLDRRLLAPRNEIQRRNGPPKKQATVQHQNIDLLRKKQLDLVDF